MIYVVVVISLCNRRRKTNQYRWISLRGIFSQSQKTWRRKIDVEVHIRSYKIKCSKAFASSWSFIHDQSLSCLINVWDLTLNIWISLLSKKRHKLLPDPSPAHNFEYLFINLQLDTLSYVLLFWQQGWCLWRRLGQWPTARTWDYEICWWHHLRGQLTYSTLCNSIKMWSRNQNSSN